MSNTNTSYEAAGTNATAARQEVKAWYKRPFALNATIMVAVILTALWLNATFSPLNLFWKLLLGVALIWGAGKLSNAKVTPATLWSKILGGLGWTIIVIALLNSGVRHASESMVNWADETLTELSGKKTATKSSRPTGGSVIKVDFPTFKNGFGRSVATGGYESAYELQFPPGKANTGTVWGVCPQVVRPEKPPVAMIFEWSNNNRSTQQVRFAESTRIELTKLGMASTSVEIAFIYVEVPQGTTDVCGALRAKLAG